VLALIPVLIIIAAWQYAVAAGLVNSKLLPLPGDVLAEAWQMLLSGMLISDIMISTRRAILGFVAGSAIGIPLGLLTGRIRLARRTLEPTIHWLRAEPALALLPLLILWFGLGESSKVILIAYGVTWPVWVNTHLGSKDLDRDLVGAARLAGADGYNLFRYIIFPLSLPFIMAGMRNGVALAFILLVAAELIGASSGIGFRLEESHMVFRTTRMIVAIIVLGGMNVVADQLFKQLVRRWSWFEEEA
jgi:ABC-type nitrate/sulfonate/bicarbonate transport system permease component